MNSAFLVDAGLLCIKDPITDDMMGYNKMDILYYIILHYTILFYDIIVQGATQKFLDELL